MAPSAFSQVGIIVSFLVQTLGGIWEPLKLSSFFNGAQKPYVPCVREGATEERTVRVVLCYIFSFTSSSGVDISCLTQFCCEVILWFLDSFSVLQSPTILNTSRILEEQSTCVKHSLYVLRLSGLPGQQLLFYLYGLTPFFSPISWLHHFTARQKQGTWIPYEDFQHSYYYTVTLFCLADGRF